MANDLNAINETDIQQALTRSLGLRDRVPVPVLAPELQAVIITADLTSSPPFDKKRVAGMGTSVTSGGASPATVQFRNPVGSGVVARISRFTVSSILTNEFVGSIGPIIAGAQIATGTWLNTGLPGIPGCDFAAGSPRATGVFFRGNCVIQGYPFFWDGALIITPGFSVQIETIALAQTVLLAWQWEEFPETPTK